MVLLDWKPKTHLVELNDDKGIRETEGKDFVVVARNGKMFAVDIAKVKTLEDLIKQINTHKDNQGQRIKAELKDGKLHLIDRSPGKERFRLISQGSLPEQLRMLQKVAVKNTLVSEKIPENLLKLNSGAGLSKGTESILRFKLSDGSEFQVDLAGATSAEEIVKRINESKQNLLVEALIHLDQKKFRFVDHTMGAGKFHVVPFSLTVQDLGLKYNKKLKRYFTRAAKDNLTLDTSLNDLNGGKRIQQGAGPDMKIALRNGETLKVDLDGAKTVGDLISRINGSKVGVEAKISPENPTMVSITDLNEGKKEFKITPYSSTLDDLWMTKYEAQSSRPNVISSIPPERFHWRVILGLLIAISVWMVIVGGIKRIGTVASKLVPFMATFYILGALTILAMNYQAVPDALYLIIYHAFNSTEAVQGGFLGAGVILTITWGVKRAIFSNEAGLGSAPIAHAAAKTDEPVREGLVAMVGPFIDTIVVCTMTALVIIVTQQWQLGETGAALTQDAFTVGLPFYGFGGMIVAGGLDSLCLLHQYFLVLLR